MQGSRCSDYKVWQATQVSECLSGVGVAGDAGGDHQSTCYRQSLPARPAQPAVNECIGNIFVQFVKR